MHSVTMSMADFAPPALIARLCAPIVDWLDSEYGTFTHQVTTRNPGLEVQLDFSPPADRATEICDEISRFLLRSTGTVPTITLSDTPPAPMGVRCTVPLVAAARARPSESPLAHAVRALLAATDLHPAGPMRGLVSLHSHYQGLKHAVLTDTAAKLDTAVSEWVDANLLWLDAAPAEPLTAAWRSALHWCAGYASALSTSEWDAPRPPTPEPAPPGVADPALVSAFHRRALPLAADYHENWFESYRTVLAHLYERTLPPLGVGIQLRAAAAGIVVEHARRSGWDEAGLFDVFDSGRPRAPIDAHAVTNRPER